MKLDEIKELAKQHGIKPAKLRKAELIQQIQMKEGNAPCFDTGQADNCGQDNCCWREDCC